MKDFVYYNSLYDIYSELLTDNERTTFEDYYHEDFSLSEIAEDRDISRSAVQKTLKNVLEKLEAYEAKLHIYVKNNKLREMLTEDNLDMVKKAIEEIPSD